MASRKDRKIVVILPYTLDVAAQEKAFTEAFKKTDTSNCYLLVPHSPARKDDAEIFFEKMVELFPGGECLSVRSANYADINTVDAAKQLNALHTELMRKAELEKMGKYETRLLNDEYKECNRRITNLLNRTHSAGFNASEMFRESIAYLNNVSIPEMEDIGFDPRDCNVLFFSEAGTQVPRTRDFFNFLDAELNHSRASVFVYDVRNIKDNSINANFVGNERLAINGCIFGEISSLHEFIGEMRCNPMHNWREKLADELDGAFTNSEVMFKEFGIPRDSVRHEYEERDKNRFGELPSMEAINANAVKSGQSVSFVESNGQTTVSENINAGLAQAPTVSSLNVTTTKRRRGAARKK